MSSRVIVFDVNETLLDLSVLDAPFQDALGDAGAARDWFSQLLRLAMTSVVVGQYRDFSTMGQAALDMLAATRGVTLPEGDRQGIFQCIRELPPHADVVPALERLRGVGLRLAALTNSAPDAVRAQLGNAGLSGYFEQILSVDAARRYKPAPDAYRAAAHALGVAPAAMRMVAVHDWDIMGALNAGCAGAFVARGGLLFYPLAEHQPDVIGRDLEDVAQQIAAIDV